MVKRIVYIGTHIIFWFVFISLSLLIGYRVDTGWHNFLLYYRIYIIQVIWAIAMFYLSYSYFAVHYFQKRRLVMHFVMSILSSSAITLFFIELTVFFGFLTWESLGIKLIQSIIGTFIIGQCGVLVRGFLNWYADVERKSEIEKENLKNELSSLKQQLNPHFLFNTLNNIDALIHTQPKDASNAIIMLSEMLRYMIYETNTEKVKLVDENVYLKHLVALHSLRHKKQNFIQFESKIEKQDTLVAPMLFLPFVENAFKYASDNAKYPCISIKLVSEKNQIFFQCKNYFNTFAKQSENNSRGFGLITVKKRLNLIYSKSHHLEISKQDDLFTVSLKINLDAN